MITTFNSVPGSPVRIMPATWRDLNALRHIERLCFQKDSWPLLDLIGVLTIPGVVRLKADIDDKMVGFIAGDVRRGENLAWIATICVLPEFRGHGIGSALLRSCEEKVAVPRIRLSVRESNHPAIQLYRQLGYDEVGKWQNYYDDGEDALVMEKIIKL